MKNKIIILLTTFLIIIIGFLVKYINYNNHYISSDAVFVKK